MPVCFPVQLAQAPVWGCQGLSLPRSLVPVAYPALSTGLRVPNGKLRVTFGVQGACHSLRRKNTWGMIVLIIPCPCTGKAKSTAFFGVNTVDLPLTLHPRQPPGRLTAPLLFFGVDAVNLPSTSLGRRGGNLVHATAFFCGVRCSVGVRLSFDSMLTGTAFFWGLHPATSHATFCREDVAASVQTA